MKQLDPEKGKWRIIKFSEDGKRLTTRRDGHRFEDFFFRPDDPTACEVYKHFGDHDYDSGTTLSDCWRTENEQVDLIYAAERFHAEYEPSIKTPDIPGRIPPRNDETDFDLF